MGHHAIMVTQLTASCQCLSNKLVSNITFQMAIELHKMISKTCRFIHMREKCFSCQKPGKLLENCLEKRGTDVQIIFIPDLRGT